VAAPPEAGLAPRLAIARLRAAAVARITSVLPGETGALAAALLVGERSLIAQEADEALRASGLAHVVSISGLHMALIAGTAYGALRALLALFPGLALNHPIRAWAAVAGLVAAIAYLAVSGGGVATVRAFVMAAVAFLAILAGRRALNLRNLAFAGFVVVALEPESVAEPGFQMSFMAVAALLAGWEAWRDRARPGLTERPRGWALRALRFVGLALAGTALTTLLAGLATAPYASFHFGRLSTLSLLGNLAAMPIVSVVVMPAGLFALIGLPLGLEAPPLLVMGAGIDAMMAVARFVAGLPGALVAAPPLPLGSVLLVSFGLLWLCLWRTRLRLLGLAFLGLGLGLAPLLLARPDVLVSANGRIVGVRDAGGALRVSGGRAGAYVLSQWFEREGAAPDGRAMREGVACDPLGCVFTGRDGLRVAHVRRVEAFPEDCRRAHLVVSALPVPGNCGAALVLGPEAIARSGGLSLTLGEGADLAGRLAGARVERAAPEAPRPWQGPARAFSPDVKTL